MKTRTGFLVALVLFLGPSLMADDLIDNPVSMNKLPLHFTENKGQFADEVLFFSRSSGTRQFITTDGMTYLLSHETEESRQKRDAQSSIAQSSVFPCAPEFEYYAFKIGFQGANEQIVAHGEDQLSWVNNYLLGGDPSGWVTGVHNFEKVNISNLYDGIDLVYYGSENQLEYDLVVRPGGDPDAISLAFDGVDSFDLTGDGELEIHTSFGSIRQSRPVAYQVINGTRVGVATSFSLRDNGSGTVVGVRVDSYDAKEPLVIDPTYRLRYLYGSDDDIIGGVDLDASGNVYVTGRTASTNFPATIGVFEGDIDAFIAKLDNMGVPIWITYLGGSDVDKGRDVAVGPFDRVYVAGGTKSADFPIAGPYVDDELEGTNMDGFVAYLSPAGDVVMYSTYLGGLSITSELMDVEDDKGTSAYAITVDDNGYFYVAGATATAGLPATTGAFDETYYGPTSVPGPSIVWLADAFAIKFSPTGSLTGGFCTYLGGYGTDVATAIDIDDNGYVYVAGFTEAASCTEGENGFPHKDGSYCEFYGPNRSTFVAKILPDGSDLEYSVAYGGCNAYNIGLGMAVDDDGYAYVTGYTGTFMSGCVENFPVTPGAFDTTFNSSRCDDAFVYKVSQDGSAIEWSTYLGGEGVDRAYGIDVDETGAPYVTGVTSSADFPVVDPGNISVPWAPPPSTLFLTKFDADGSRIDFSARLGTPYEDQQYGPACAYRDQAVALTGYYEIVGAERGLDGMVYVLDVNDLYQSMAFDSIGLRQTTLFPLFLDSVNQRIMTIEVNTTGVSHPLQVTHFALGTAGSDNPAADITNARLFYLGNATSLDTTRPFGTNVPNPSGPFAFNGSQTLISGTNRFALTYDIPSSASIADSVDAECFSVTVDGTVYTPSVTSPGGGAVISAGPAGLAGTGQVGPSGDFVDLNEAIDAVVRDGLAGDLILEVEPGHHLTHVAPSGSYSAARSQASQAILGNLIIQSSGSPNAAELEYYATDSLANFVIQPYFWGYADTVFIRNLTITALGDDYATAIELTEGSSNIYVENCILNGSPVQSGPMKHKALIRNWLYGGCYSTNVVFKGNTFNGGAAGIYLESGLDSIRIDSNTFIDPLMYGVLMYDHHNLYIGKNTFVSTWPHIAAVAIAAQNCFNGFIIEKNQISSSFQWGIQMTYCCGDVSNRGLVSNNFVSMTNNLFVIGMACYDGFYLDIFNNSVNVTSADTNAVCLVTSDISNVSMANNILVNTGGGYTYKDIPPLSQGQATSTHGADWSDFNDFYATGTHLASWNGANIDDLASLKAATGMEDNSLSVDPGFASVTDLHTTSPELEGAGIYLDRVPDDIDGNPRDPLNPSMGGGVYIPLDVDDETSDVLPDEFKLMQNFPNPFNPATTIEYSVPTKCQVSIEVFNILGQNVRTLVNETKAAGNYRTEWNGSDEAGKTVATGVYFYRLRSGDVTHTKKMVMIK